MFNVQLYLKCQESWYQPSRSPTIWFRFPAPSQTISRVPVIKKVNGNYCMDVWNISGWCSSNIHLSNTLRFGFTKSKEACKKKSFVELVWGFTIWLPVGMLSNQQAGRLISAQITWRCIFVLGQILSWLLMINDRASGGF